MWLLHNRPASWQQPRPLHQNCNHGDLRTKWKGSKWILRPQAQWSGCYWPLHTISAPESGEALPLADATVGSFRRKVMYTRIWWKKLENNGVPEPILPPWWGWWRELVYLQLAWTGNEIAILFQILPSFRERQIILSLNAGDFQV